MVPVDRLTGLRNRLNKAAASEAGFTRTGYISGNVAYRFGGAGNDPSDQSFLLTVGFRL